MELKELIDFIKVEAKRLEQRFGKEPDHEKTILSSSVKLYEELGELSELVLSSKQRKEKNVDANKEALADEFADVLIAVSMLAHDMNVDIEEALKNKIKKINERYE